MIFHINFFLFTLGQSTVFSYSLIFAKHYSDVTTIEFGRFIAIIPIVIFFIRPITCQIADGNGSHRKLLIIIEGLFLTSYASLCVIAFIKDPKDNSYDRLAWYAICPLLAIGIVSTNCIFSLNDALASNYARKHNMSYGTLRMFSNIGWCVGAILVMFLSTLPLPSRTPGLILLIVVISFNLLILYFWPYNEDFEMFHDGSSIEDRKLSIVGPNTRAYIASREPRLSISKDFLDRIKAGRSKSVGAISKLEGMKPTGSQQDQEKPQKEYTNFQCQLMLLKLIGKRHKSLIKYFALFITCGIIQGMVTNFENDFIKEEIISVRYPNDKEAVEHRFEFISNLCMIAQTMGDMPTNFFSGSLIRWFGFNSLLSVAYLFLGLRTFYYANILPYTSDLGIMIPEMLQGPSLGIICVLAVEIGSHYALMVTDFIPELHKKGIIKSKAHEKELEGCLRATMIGLMSSSVEGLGYSLGSLIGSRIKDSYSYITMWNICAYTGFIIGFANIGLELKRKLGTPSSKNQNQVSMQTLMIPNITVFSESSNTNKLSPLDE